MFDDVRDGQELLATPFHCGVDGKCVNKGKDHQNFPSVKIFGVKRPNFRRRQLVLTPKHRLHVCCSSAPSFVMPGLGHSDLLGPHLTRVLKVITAYKE